MLLLFFLRTSAFTHNNVFPMLDLQFGRVVFVQVENVYGFKFAGVAAGPLDQAAAARHVVVIVAAVPALNVDKWLEEGVVVARQVARRAPAHTIVRVKLFWLKDKVKALEILQVDLHVLAAAFLTAGLHTAVRFGGCFLRLLLHKALEELAVKHVALGAPQPPRMVGGCGRQGKGWEADSYRVRRGVNVVIGVLWWFCKTPGAVRKSTSRYQNTFKYRNQ